MKNPIILPVLAVAALTVIISAPAMAEEITIETRPVTTFRFGSDQTQFGDLKFLGGLELLSSARHFDSLSGFDFYDGRSQFVAVSDRGYWITGKVMRKDNVPDTIADAQLFPMRNAMGDLLTAKEQSDAEAVRVDGNTVAVGFERDARVEIYRLPIDDRTTPIRTELHIPRAELRFNKGIETIAIGPAGTLLEGARVTIAERSINPDGNIFAAISNGPKAGVFFVRRNAPYDVTDGDFLPDGDLLLLQRRYNQSEGIGMRLVRIPGETIEPGATVDGEVLLEADFGYQIDNMEGLSVTTDEAGQVFVTLISDDNGSFFQRTLLLEFQLEGRR